MENYAKDRGLWKHEVDKWKDEKLHGILYLKTLLKGSIGRVALNHDMLRPCTCDDNIKTVI
jgi:hypothetical protein